jgi:hypothetical protein
MQKVSLIPITLGIALLGSSQMLSSAAMAAIPELINYQGQLTDAAGVPLDTVIMMKTILILVAAVDPVSIETRADADGTADPSSGEQIKWQVISSDGTDGGSASLRLRATAGQAAIGTGGSQNLGLSAGFLAGAGGRCRLSAG